MAGFASIAPCAEPLESIAQCHVSARVTRYCVYCDDSISSVVRELHHHRQSHSPLAMGDLLSMPNCRNPLCLTIKHTFRWSYFSSIILKSGSPIRAQVRFSDANHHRLTVPHMSSSLIQTAMPHHFTPGLTVAQSDKYPSSLAPSSPFGFDCSVSVHSYPRQSRTVLRFDPHPCLYFRFGMSIDALNSRAL